ncbi:MAG: glycoside hydrolase family 2 TIM barrel-domain containing protein [Planctomycetia bacterium]|nr:glycoside hydrolase family 2 TIM barrel-domain containing protein [Planctomycetia bacterium]
MRKNVLSIIFLLFVSICLTFVSAKADDDWKPAKGILLSKFAKDVNPNNVLQEYPRPQMVRDEWRNLNGLWDYAILPVDQKYDDDQGEILVPFAVESALSGVARRVGKDNNLWYEKSIEIPKKWNGKRIMLNFGAVDWKCEIFVNDKLVGSHQGGYTPFSVDITDALENDDDQEILVKVWDPTTDGPQPIGKQHNNPHGIWYTPVTGIWQTVWMEPVSAAHITKVLPISNIDDKTVSVTVFAEGIDDDCEAMLKGKTAKFVDGKATISFDFADAELWTPDNPKLYDLSVSLKQKGETVDKVKTYFAMRKISLGKTEDGITRMMLNNEFLFQHGPLDQGWWPDGLYTAPTDEALKFDVQMTKEFGFNMLRKHVKVEPARFYYHCDSMGMLVWQDMPSGDTAHYISPTDPDAVRSPESVAIYEDELKQMISAFEFFPSIIMWVPFNEGWGQFDTPRIVDMVRQLDGTRLVNNTSGWSDRNCGDVYDKHVYPGPDMFPPEENRATVLGEYGGLGLPIKGHSWKDDGNWGYVSFNDKEGLFKRYQQLNRALRKLIIKGLSAAVYTQTTDVEIEVNGLMSYDREVIKMPTDKLYESNTKLRVPLSEGATETKLISRCAKSEDQIWKYSTEKPADNWAACDFDDSAWKEGPSGFGTKETPNSIVRTLWDTNDIWIRRVVEFSEESLVDLSAIQLYIFHDEDAEVFINGKQVASFENYVGDYFFADMDTDVLKEVLKPGKNTVAVHCKQTRGGQYIDLGIVWEAPAKK